MKVGFAAASRNQAWKEKLWPAAIADDVPVQSMSVSSTPAAPVPEPARRKSGPCVHIQPPPKCMGGLFEGPKKTRPIESAGTGAADSSSVPTPTCVEPLAESSAASPEEFLAGRQ